MGLEAARASLECAVTALFTKPQVVPTDACATCGGSLTLPAAWRALRDFPVCARFVLATWSRLAASLAPLQTPNEKATKRKNVALSSGSELRAASMAQLCALLYLCGLVAGSTVDDSEVVAMVVHAMCEHGIADRAVLCRVLQQYTLPRCVRFRLFQHALSTQSQRQSDSAWIGEVAHALAEELRQASIERVAHGGPSTSPAQKSRKRGRGSMGKSTKTVNGTVCDVCEEGQRSDSCTTRTPRTALVDLLEQWLKVDDGDGTVGEAVEGLVGVLNAPEVVVLLERTNPASSITRPRTIPSSRSTRVVPSPKIRWDTCDSIIETACPTAWWRLVWRRERSRMNRSSPMGTLDALVAVCVIADQFASSAGQASDCADHGGATTGFRVLRAVMDLSIKSADQTAAILRALSAALDRKTAAATNAVSKASLHQTRRQLIQYARQFLVRDGTHELQAAQDTTVPTAKGRAKNASRTPSREVHAIADLVECVRLVHILVAAASQSTYVEGAMLSTLWFQLVLKFTSDASDHAGSATAPLWSSFLDSIAQCWEELDASSHPCARAFEAFVVEMVVGILVSGGTRISAPEGCDIEPIAIPLEATSQSMLQALLSMILNAGASNRVVVASIYDLFVIFTRQQQARLLRNSSDGGISFPRVLFPSLSACGNTTSETVTALVAKVHSRIHTQRESARLARIFVVFLHQWDNYSERHNPDVTTGASHHTGDKRGILAARDHGVWKDLLRFYASEPTDGIARETPAFLAYVSELLQSVDPDDCPSELEGSLFSVVTKITSTLSQSQARREREVVTHSDETIVRFLRAFDSPTSASDHDCHHLIEVLNSTGKLEDLALVLRRWLGILANSSSAVSTETAAKLVMLANRLIYFCRSEFEAVKPLLVPIDDSLQSALELYSTSSSSSTSQVSVVRLSVMVRAYLAVSRVPDLVGLTTAIVDTALTSPSSSARDGLLKLLQGCVAFLVIEVVKDKLQTALLLVGDRVHLRQVRNALAVITNAPEMLRPRGSLMAHDVFSVATAERWLTTLLLVGVAPPESIAKTLWKTVEALLASLEALLEQEERSDVSDDSLFRHGYALDALLSTALLVSLPADEPSSIHTRVRDISHQLQSRLRGLDEIPVADNPRQADKDHHLLLVTGSKRYLRNGTHSTEMEYASGLVRVDRTRLHGLETAPSTLQGWTRIVDLTEAEKVSVFGSTRPGDGTTRCYLAFSSWLASAFSAQRQLPAVRTSVQSSGVWETVFTDTVLRFYLPIQFYGDMDALVSEWLATWVQLSLSIGHLIDVLPFQRSILLQHLAVSSPWSHLIHCARSLTKENIPATVGREIMHHIVGALDMVVLSSTRGLPSDAVRAMADDLTVLMKQQQFVSIDSSHYLTIVAPLLEAFVRVSLLTSIRDPNGQATVMDDVHRIGIFVHRVLAQSHTMGTWWSQLLATWTRQLSHLNRRDAPRIIEALVWK